MLARLQTKGCYVHRGKCVKLTMKKIFASVGLAAIGASSLQAQYAPGLTAVETSKPWSVSASLRGFYDDNYLTLPGHFAVTPSPSNPSGQGSKRSSFGAEFAPSIAFNHSTEDTLLSASYVYDFRYYFDHSAQDSSHQINLKMDHQFSERYKLNVSDSFVIAQEPTVIDPSVITSPLRVNGNNVRNTGNLDFFATLTKLLDLHLGYANTMTAYQQTQGDVFGLDTATPGVVNGANGPSRSAALDRIDQLAVVDLRWKFLPETTGVTGYQFEHIDYTSPEYIIFPNATLPGGLSAESGTPGNAGFRANIRDSDSHFVFVGVDQSITPDLNATVRVGAEYVDYSKVSQNRLSPYADANITWQFFAQSYAQAGVKHIHNSTDVTGTFGNTSPVLDEESTAAYVSVSHTISSFTVSALGQAQWSTFDGGGAGFDNKDEDFYIAGVNLAYHINPFLLAEAGYNFNRLISDLSNRGYVRNQVYIGLRATY
jgi:hypothetical protein